MLLTGNNLTIHEANNLISDCFTNNKRVPQDNIANDRDYRFVWTNVPRYRIYEYNYSLHPVSLRSLLALLRETALLKMAE